MYLHEAMEDPSREDCNYFSIFIFREEKKKTLLFLHFKGEGTEYEVYFRNAMTEKPYI